MTRRHGVRAIEQRAAKSLKVVMFCSFYGWWAPSRHTRLARSACPAHRRDRHRLIQIFQQEAGYVTSATAIRSTIWAACGTLPPVAAGKSKTFRSVLERAGKPLYWVITRIPFDAKKVWHMGARIKVKGTINGFAFRTSLFPSRNGGHVLLVNKKMQAGGGVGPGEVAKFVLEPDTAIREATIPAELKRELDEDKALRRWFDRLNYSTRKWICGLDHGCKEQRRTSPAGRTDCGTIDANDGC